jgi:competence protein ComEC
MRSTIGPCIACFLVFAIAGQAGPADGRLDIYWNDVEGGAATLIVTPAGESVLIDSGHPGARDANRIYQTATHVAGLRKIDFLIITHFHLDHFGGAAALSQLIPIGQVYDRGIPQHGFDGDSDGWWFNVSNAYRTFEAGGRNRVIPGLVIPLKQAGAQRVSLRCVASVQRFIDAPVGARPNPLAGEDSHRDVPSSENDRSSAWVLDFGPFRFWDAGDPTWNMEAKLVVPINRVGQVDVYQTDHHGLPDGSNPVLVHSLAPTVSVMDDGSTTWIAPTVKILRSCPGLQAMYQLHKSANVQPRESADNAPDEFIANFSSSPNHADANYIKLSVDPDGKSYTISIPGTGHTRTYQTHLNKN